MNEKRKIDYANKINSLFGEYHETLDDGMNVIRLDGEKWKPLIMDIVNLFDKEKIRE